MIHKIAHITITQNAQLHFYGSLVTGFIFSVITIFSCFQLMDTAHRRSQKDRLAGVIMTLGCGLISVAVLRNTFVPLKPHHFDSVFIPASGLGAVLFVGGMLLLLASICLIPKGEAGKWLDAKSQENEEVEADAGVWPPAPKT